MKNLVVLFVGLFLMICFIPVAVNAQAESTKVEMAWGTWIQCANDGLGENAFGTLVLHTVTVFDNAGNIKKIHNQPAGGELIGEITGTVYHPTGVTQEIFNSNSATNYTYTNIYHMVGEDGIQVMSRVIYHITLNANGELVAEVDKTETICK